ETVQHIGTDTVRIADGCTLIEKIESPIRSQDVLASDYGISSVPGVEITAVNPMFAQIVVYTCQKLGFVFIVRRTVLDDAAGVDGLRKETQQLDTGRRKAAH